MKVAAAKAVTVLSRHLKYRAQREEVVQILIDGKILKCFLNFFQVK